MKRRSRWTGRGVAGMLVFVLVAYAVVYVSSERALHRTYAVPAVRLSIPTDPASVTEGRRLATIRGCSGDCHGRESEGALMIDDPMLARIVAPNLAAAARNY